MKQGSEGLHQNLSPGFEPSLHARTYSGFLGFAVSPHSWGDSPEGIVEEERRAYSTRKHGVVQNDFYPGRVAMRYLCPVCPCLALPMSLLLLAGLAGCGPAPSDNASTLDSRASQGEPPLSQKDLPPRTDLLTPATSSAKTSPAPLVSENGNGSLPEKGPVPGGDSPHTAPTSSTKPGNPMDVLDVPAWMAKDLASPDVDIRLRTLDTWVLTAPGGSIDPLILAFENDEERVRARAMELIVQD